MADIPKMRLAMAKQKAQIVLTSRRTRRVALIATAVIAVYAVLGFFAAPALIRHIGQKQLSEQLDRPATIGRVALNPFTLRFEVDGLHIADKASASSAFVDIQRLIVRPSWSSLFHFAPIIKEVQIDAPVVSIVRYDAEHFNFSDLIAKFSKPSANPTPGKPARFAVSNIHIENGQIHFDDQLMHAQHVVDHFSLGVPFVATLASATDIFVTPSLQARIDGSPLSVVGRTKPFSQSKESDVQLKLNGLDLPRLASYLPASVPVTVKRGQLSTNLDVAFSIAGDAPTIHISGTADLADFAATDHQDAPLASFHGLHLAIANAEPLRSVYALDDVSLNAPDVTLSRDAKGVLNIEKLLGATGSSDSAKTATAISATSSTASAASIPTTVAANEVPATPLDLSIKHVSVESGSVSFNDASVSPHTTLGLSKLAVTVDNFSTLAKTPAPYTLKTVFDHGGNLNLSGDLSLAEKQTHLKLALDSLDLPPLQPYLPSTIQAKLTSGKLSIALPIDVAWSAPQPAINVGAGSLTLRALTLTPNGDVAPVSLTTAVATVRKIDVNARTAALESVQVTGLTLAAKRLKDGSIDLSTLAGASASPSDAMTPDAKRTVSAATATAQSTSSVWHYQIGKIALDNATANFTDQTTARPVKLRISPLQLSVQSVSDDLHNPLTVDGQLTLNGTGSLGVRGTITPDPLKVALHVDSKQLDVSTFEPYFGDALNVSMASASLNANGDVAFSGGASAATGAGSTGTTGATPKAAKSRETAAVGKPAKSGETSSSGNTSQMAVRYDGDVALTNVKMVDKVSGDAVAGWKLLGASGVKLAYNAHATDVDVSKITFARFYGRVLLDAQGKLNLRDIVATKPVAGKGKNETKAPETATVKVAANPTASAHPTTLRIGQVVLEDGRVTYSDNFVRPNYTANLLAINGTIGAFGTHATAPAPVDVAASLSGNGPVSIKGNVNPLLDKPALDLTASAHDVELMDLTPYASKYVGYPITKGKLNVDLHYALADNNLTANNHLFIDQLTFGDRVDAPGVTHLPVRLAVSLLKNSRGEIDVNIPVSGSLDNPQFSIGSVVWHAVLNLVERAVTAPFSLLTHAFGGGGDTSALQYVAFEPGSAVLTTAAQKKLDTIGAALASKPTIQLGLTPHVDPRVDAPALRTAYLENQVKLAKLKDTGGSKDASANAANLSSVTVEANEYDKYLTAAYKASDFKKPRNFIGMTKTLPADEMEKALSDNAPVDTAALKTLTQQRATAVQSYLGKQIDVKRISIASAPSSGASVAVAASTATASNSNSNASTRVDFTLQ